MSIEARDRKILWALAHNSCAICKQGLVVNATEVDRESVVGDEAHIVAQSDSGPRAGLIPSAELDKYENLILLCKVHHKQVDDQPKFFTAERLRELKAEHERWAQERFGAAIYAVHGDGKEISGSKVQEFFLHVPSTISDIHYVIAHRPWAWECLLYAGYLKVGIREARAHRSEVLLPRPAFVGDAATAREYTIESLKNLDEIHKRLGWVFDPNAVVEAFGSEGASGEFILIHGLANRFLKVYEEMLSWSDAAKRTTSTRKFKRLVGYISQSADLPIDGMEKYVELMTSRLEKILNDKEAQTGKPSVITLDDHMIGPDKNLLEKIVRECDRI